MIAAMAPRCPDDRAWWHDGSVALGHGLLRTTPEDEPQPLAQAGLVITADARLDNGADLAAALDLTASTPVSAASLIWLRIESGASVARNICLAISPSYFGTVSVEHCSLPATTSVSSPLYYHHNSRRFCWASEIKALFVVPDVRRSVDEVQLADFLARDIDDPAATLFRDIRRLPAGHRLSVSADDRLRIDPYWRLELPDELRLGADVEYAARFRELFEAAVRCRLHSDRPIGAKLSGGLDSSSIVCVARSLRSRENAPPLPTFSQVFDRTPEYNERSFIERVAARGGIDTHFIAADDHAPFSDIADILRSQDEIFFAPGVSRSYSLYKTAAACDVRTLLDGHGGDEVVSQGLAYLHELALAGRWVKACRELGGISRIYGESPIETLSDLVGRYGLARQRARYPLIDRLWRAPKRLQGWLRFERDRPDSMTWRQFISDDLVRRTGVVERKRQVLDAYARALRSERTEHLFVMSAGRHARVRGSGRAAAAAGVETRYPFYDKRLVEFCLALPPEQKLRGGWSRRVLRHAMAGLLPPEIQWRQDKLDFTPHLITGMLTHHRALIDEVIGADVGGVGRYMNLTALRQAYARLLREGTETRGPEAHAIWLAVALALWLQRLDEPPAASAPSRLAWAPAHA